MNKQDIEKWGHNNSCIIIELESMNTYRVVPVETDAKTIRSLDFPDEISFIEAGSLYSACWLNLKKVTLPKSLKSLDDLTIRPDVHIIYSEENIDTLSKYKHDKYLYPNTTSIKDSYKLIFELYDKRFVNIDLYNSMYYKACSLKKYMYKFIYFINKTDFKINDEMKYMLPILHNYLSTIENNYRFIEKCNLDFTTYRQLMLLASDFDNTMYSQIKNNKRYINIYNKILDTEARFDQIEEYIEYIIKYIIKFTK